MVCCLRLHECIRMYSGVCGLRGTYLAPNSLLLVKCAVMHCHRGLANGSVRKYVYMYVHIYVHMYRCNVQHFTRNSTID